MRSVATRFMQLRIIDPQWLSNGRLMLLHSSNTTLLGGRLEPYATVWTYENRLRRELGYANMLWSLDVHSFNVIHVKLFG